MVPCNSFQIFNPVHISMSIQEPNWVRSPQFIAIIKINVDHHISSLFIFQGRYKKLSLVFLESKVIFNSSKASIIIPIGLL